MSKNTSTIESLMDGYNPQRQLLEQTRKLVKKWEPTGLLEGLNKEHEVNGMSVLLENQARQLIDEASRTGVSANSEEWSGVALPLVRRIFGELAAQEFVSVQPMNLPSGLIFYLDFKYGTAKANRADGDNIHGTTDGAGDASGGLYGAGKFGYSINDQSNTIAYTTSSVTYADVDYEASLSASLANLSKVTLALPTGYDPDGIRAFTVSGSGDDEVTLVDLFDTPNVNGGTPGYDVPQDMFDKVANTEIGSGDATTNAVDPNFEIPSEWKYSLGATYTTENKLYVKSDTAQACTISAIMIQMSTYS